MNRQKYRYSLLRASLIVTMLTLQAGCRRDDATAASTDSDPVVIRKQSVIPEFLPNMIRAKRDSKTYTINGIGIRGDLIVAIINDEVVKAGERLGDGVFVKEVRPTYAVVVVENREHYIRPSDIQRQLDQTRKQT